MPKPKIEITQFRQHGMMVQFRVLGTTYRTNTEGKGLWECSGGKSIQIRSTDEFILDQQTRSAVWHAIDRHFADETKLAAETQKAEEIVQQMSSEEVAEIIRRMSTEEIESLSRDIEKAHKWWAGIGGR